MTRLARPLICVIVPGDGGQLWEAGSRASAAGRDHGPLPVHILRS